MLFPGARSLISVGMVQGRKNSGKICAPLQVKLYKITDVGYNIEERKYQVFTSGLYSEH